MTMDSMESMCPQSRSQLIEIAFRVENNQPIGVDRNVAAPAQQINIASAVTRDNCRSEYFY